MPLTKRRSRSSSAGPKRASSRSRTRGGRRTNTPYDDGTMSADEDMTADPLGDMLNTNKSPDATLSRVKSPVRRHTHTTPGAASFRYKSMHTVEQPSVLSSEAPPSSYRGLLNLALILLILSNFRLVLVNLRKYGLLVNFGMVTGVVSGDGRWPAFEVLVVQGTLIFVIFACERQAIAIGRAVVDRLHWLTLLTILVFPVVHIYKAGNNVVTAGNVLILSVIIFMKLWSFTVVNSELHSRYIDGKDTRYDPCDDPYPDNLSLAAFIRFMFMPTLCYQVSFPRTEGIRWPFVLKRSLEFVFISVFIVMFTEQYTLPLINNTLPIMKREGRFNLRFAERVLKLGVPNLITWLLWFYSYFHLFFNILAELTQFGDRRFYLDWWNATSLDYFWRTWNLPVHNWLVRHVYLPLIRRGWTKKWALFFVFMLSAVMHEYFVSPPTKTFKAWAFLGMLAQIPLIWLTRVFSHHSFGNVVFWFSIIMGQPLLIFFYSHEAASIATAAV